MYNLFLLIGSIFFKKTVSAKVPRSKITVNSKSHVYRALNGNPSGNIIKIVELMGGIDKLFGKEDIILIKPNLQWWNQGAPNLNSFKTFIELIINQPGGFNGEIVLMENVHRGNEPWLSMRSGWAPVFERNVDLPGIRNMSDLVIELKNKYSDQFTVYHLIDIKTGGKRVYSPEDGSGYVYCDGTNGVPLFKIDNGLEGDDYRETIMTYPIIKSDRGTIIDFKNGIWENNAYTNQPLRFINMAALNHHSSYCGMTSAIKNYMGISDLSGGPDPFDDGILAEKYYNFHSFPFNKWEPGPSPGMLGAEMGEFMSIIRQADLNITTAEYVGLVSRTEPPIALTHAILASTDPVALDYHAAKYFLYPNSSIWFHNPDNSTGPLYEYLNACAEKMNGIFDEKFVEVKSYDFKKNELHTDENLVVLSEIEWGGNAKALLKYVFYRLGLM